VTIPVPGRLRYAGCEIDAAILDRYDAEFGKTKPDRHSLREYFDLDRLHAPIVVRTRQRGDRFQPLGSAGAKKVGKFLTTAKVPCAQRTRILVFADQEKIIWVCPARISEQAKVTSTTRRVLALTVTPPRAPATSGSM
jgi:tRNA(Ile)-lysidine synthase